MESSLIIGSCTSYAARGSALKKSDRNAEGVATPSAPVRPVRVEPVHPLRRGELDIISAFPGTPVPDEFGLIECVQRFGEGIIV